LLNEQVRLPLHHAASEPDPDVVKTVLGYFVRNRKAADTLEGVTRWRLLDEQVNRSLQQTDAAIAWLVEQGFLEELRPAGSAVPVFRLNPDRHAEAAQYLAGKSKGQTKSGGGKRR
jgi:hypothetical protein